jgi:hypothetical protein
VIRDIATNMRCAALGAGVLCGCTVGSADPFPGSVTAGSAGSVSTAGTTGEASDGSSSGATDAGTGEASSSSATAGDSSGGDATGASASASSEGSSESASDTSATGDGAPLDPELDIPNGGEECTTPGDLNECPGIAVCRFATTEHGLCESCDDCGNLNAPCVEGTDCDILFSCYAGRCTNFCTLGTSECGPVEDCLDIGHPTHGVCDPFA